MNEYLNSIGGTVDEYTEAAAYYDALEENNTKVKLKPCPFCGGKAKRGLFMGLSTVVCTNCPACVLPVPGEKYEDRVRDWNKREEG